MVDAGELRVWLAEHAEVELPGTYAFWGRYTPEGDVPRQRLLYLDERNLRIGWLIDGCDTTVDIALLELGDGSTSVLLEQSHFPGLEAAIREESVRGYLHTFWSLALANLVDYLEGRPLTPKADFSSLVMSEEMVIDGVASVVYDALVDSDKFSRWFGFRIDIEPQVGGRWAMGGFEVDPEPAKVVDVVPDRKIAIRFPDGMVCAWELEESGGRTRLTFVQSGFDLGRPPYGAWMGWLSGFAELRRFVELDDWRPIWLEVDVGGMSPEYLTAE